MKIGKALFISALFLFSSLHSIAQRWVIKFYTSSYYYGGTNAPCYLPSYTFSIGGNTVTGNNTPTRKNDLVLWGSDWKGINTKTLSASVQISCPSPNPKSIMPQSTILATGSVDLSSWTGSCLSGFIELMNGTTSYGGISFTFYSQLNLKAREECGATTLSVEECTSTVGGVIWEVTDDALFNSPKTLTSNSSTVTVTALDLLALGATSVHGKNWYARVKDKGISHRESDIVPFIVQAQAPTVALNGKTNIICHGESNGKIVLDISNTAPQANRFYINCYHADGSSRLESTVYPGLYEIEDLKAGDWTFEVVNNAYNPNNPSDPFYNTYIGRCSKTISPAITISDPDPVTIEFNTPNYNGYPIKCNGDNNGEVTAMGRGGSESFQNFSWSTGATTDKITDLAAGTYRVSLTDTNNCPASASVTLQQPDPLHVTLQPSDFNGYSVSCWNKNDGRIETHVTGGAGVYSYNWTNGANVSTATSLDVNTYGVTVEDGNGCSVKDTLTLKAPLPIDFNIEDIVGLDCPGDQTASFEVKQVTNTIGAVAYSWSSGETTPFIENKGADTYSITVSDEQGCSTTKSKILADPPAHTVAIAPLSDFNGSIIKCNGEDNGELSAIVKDSNSTVVNAQNYLWTKDGTKIGESATLTSVDHLSEGFYKVVITYDRQCETEASFLLADPDPVDVTVLATSDYNGQALSCHDTHDASIRATTSGGTGSYAYRWDSGDTNSLLTDLGAGTYTVTVTDVNTCSGSSSIAIDNPEPVQARILSASDYSGYGVSCYGTDDGTIASEVTGGTGVYTYAWTSGQITPTITDLAAGSYALTVSDNNGCKHSIIQDLTTPPPLALSLIGQKNISCFDGSDGVIKLQSSGGAGDYTYSIDNTSTWQTESTFEKLTQGSYSIILRDANNCTQNVPAILTQPTEINVDFTGIQPASCNNPQGTATAVVTGGVGRYSYLWQDSKTSTKVDADEVLSGVQGGVYTLNVHDGNSCLMKRDVAITSADGAQSSYTATPSTCSDSPDGSAAITIISGSGPFTIGWPNGQNTLQGVNLNKGLYYVTITDNKNCTVVQTVEVPGPDAIQLNVKNEIQPTCNGNCDGQLTLEATGGTGAFVYQWNNHTGASQTLLCAATYPVIVKDANGCTLTTDIILKQPDPLKTELVRSTLATCYNGCDGSLEVTTSGGNGGYLYTWADGSSTSTQANICPGPHALTIIDQKGCKEENIIILDNTLALPLDLGGAVVLCTGQAHTLDAGPNWVSILWGSTTNFTSTEQQVIIKDAGSYWLAALNDKGCVARDTFLLETSVDLLQASFMIPKEAEAGDTVVMVDVSWPLPETVEWIYPAVMKEILNTGDVLHGQFDDVGTYEVTLAARLGECYDQVTKSIIVIEKSEDPNGGRLGYVDYVKQFTLHPNPNDGSFEVGVEFTEEGPATVSVWRAPLGILIKQVHQSGQEKYRLAFDLRPLSPGTYILRLDHKQGREYIRFVVY